MRNARCHCIFMMFLCFLPYLLFQLVEGILPSEVATIQNIYVSFDGDNWNPSCRAGWTTNTDPCTSYYGITCTADSVTSIQLSQCNLGGFFPSLSALQNLTFVSLGQNSIRRYPSQNLTLAFQLPNLTHFDIAQNGLLGPLVIPSISSPLTLLNLCCQAYPGWSSTMPSSLFNISSLQYLNIAYGFLNGAVPFIGNLSNLKYLYFLQNSLSDPNNQLSSLLMLPNLNYLDFGVNNLQGPLNLPSNLTAPLKYLNLGTQSPGFQSAIPSQLSTLTLLNSMRLDNCALIGAVPKEFGNMPNLQSLSLNNNRLIGQLPSSINQSSKLTQCDFSNNIALWCLQNCPICSLASQRIQVLNRTLFVYGGLASPLSNSDIRVIDSQSTSPILFNFSEISSSVGRFQQNGLATFSSDSTAVNNGSLSFLSQLNIPNMTSIYISISTSDGFFIGPYPFTLTVLPVPYNVVQAQSVQYWNKGLPISLLAFLNTTNVVATSDQIFYDFSNISSFATINFRNGTAGITSFSQQNVNMDLVLLTLPLNFAGSINQWVTVHMGLNLMSMMFNIVSAPVISGDYIYSSSLSLVTAPTITNVSFISRSTLYLQGNSFNNVSYINYVKVNNTLCPVINVSFTSLFCATPDTMSSSKAFTIILFTISSSSSWNTTYLYNPIDQSPNSNSAQSNVTVGASIGATVSFVFCLGLYFCWSYRRYKSRKISSIKDHSLFELEIQRTRWEMLQSPTPQYLAGLTTIMGESDALSVPAYLVINGDEKIRLMDQIGAGTAGRIYRAELLDFKINNHTANDCTVAVKLFKQELVDLTSFHQEVAIMAKMSFCPYIMRLYGYIEERTRMAIVMRLCPYSLFELIHNRTAFNINARVWKGIFSDAIRGIVAMHSVHVAHLDIKPSNIMIECTGNKASNFTPLLTDFGLSQSFAKSNIKGWQMSKVKGASIQYCDPQTLKLIQLGSIKHVKLSQAQAFARDQYSLGITGWEIITRQRPWHGMDTEAIMTAVVQFNERPIWPKESSEIDWKQIVESMWTFEGRIPLQEALLALDTCDNNIDLFA